MCAAGNQIGCCKLNTTVNAARRVLTATHNAAGKHRHEGIVVGGPTLCPYLGRARYRAWQTLRVTSRPPQRQQLTPAFRWHASCTLSCGAIEKDLPKEIANAACRI